MKTPSRSRADEAFARLVAHIASGHAMTVESDKLSEADTRAKLIDPIFRDVLGWTEAEIRREASITSGFADYVLGADFNYLLVEAKRTKPRFRLAVTTRARRLRIGGPHLLGDKKLKPFLMQSRNYAVDLGAQFALLTNGSQFIIFQPYTPGRSWEHGNAIVWHDLNDVRDEFQEFYALLSRENVSSGGLAEAFQRIDGVPHDLFRPLDYIQNPDRELIRNPFWAKISTVLGPLLADVPENESQQIDVITHCYVTTPLSDQADQSLDRLLRDTMPKYLLDAGAQDVQPGGRYDAFSNRLTNDVQMVRPGTYILTGGVGSGKTTFLRRFAAVVGKSFVLHYCVWLHVDFLAIGNVDQAAVDSEIRRYTYRRIREVLEREYPANIPKTGEDVRALFADDINKAKLTLLHGIAEDSDEWTREVNRLVDELYSDDAKVAHALLTQFRRRGLRTVVVFDNTDQLGELVQERVFLLAQKVADDYGAFCVVALREEKFFAAYRRGIFDAFGDRRFHIGSPDLVDVLRKRLEYGRTKFRELDVTDELALPGTNQLATIDDLLQTIIHSIKQNQNIVRMLACVSNGDMRYALDMFRAFVSSGNTNIEKIIDIVRDSGFYTVPFHEFAKSAILGSRKYFRASVSHIVNVFAKSEARSASHTAALRVLARLSAAEGVASTHGAGFVDVSKLLREYRESFGIADDMIAWCNELLRRGLIQSEPPKASDLTASDAVRIAAAGAYYWKYLVRSFAYLDLVFADTPIISEELARELAELSESRQFEERFRRVRLFLDHIEAAEAQELEESARRSGPYVHSLVREVRKQVEDELELVTRRLPTRSDMR